MTEPPSVQVTGGKALHVSRIDSGASKSESHDESTPGAVRERKRRADAGLRDEAGREASPVTAGIDKDEYGARVSAKLGGRTEIPPPSGYQVFAPTIDTFLKEHLFCDIFIRDNLTHKQRELATIGALGAMTGTAGQLNFHLGAALNTGTTPEEMRDYLVEIERAAGAGQAEVARGGAREHSRQAQTVLTGKLTSTGRNSSGSDDFFRRGFLSLITGMQRAVRTALECRANRKSKGEKSC